jgi:biopolymer transport protein TolR
MGMQLSSHSNGRGGGKRRRSFRPNSDINVTPLVDVMLVLLVIFMITAPMMTVGVPVDLPKTQAAQINDQEEPLIISVDETGKVYLQETEMLLEEAVSRLKALTGNNPNTKIYVRGDKKLAYGQIMEIMGGIAASGFSKVSLIAELPASPPPSMKGAKESTKKQASAVR